MKRFLSCIITFSMLFTLSANAFAVNIEDSASQSGYINTASVEDATVSDVSAISQFGIITPGLATKADIEQHCVLISTESVDGINVAQYISNDLSEELRDCAKINWVNTINDILYICYDSNDGKTVIIGYSDSGLWDTCVYDPSTDSAVYVSSDTQTKYNGLRNGLTYTMSSETSQQIDAYVEENDISGLMSMNDIDVIESPDGSISIEEKMPDEFAAVVEDRQISTFSAPTTESQLMDSLKKDFPMYTNSLKMSTTKRCAALDKNISIKVKESREKYKKQNADWGSWSAGTAVSLIAMAIDVKATVVIKILKGIGVAISAANQINKAAKLCKSAKFDYYGGRKGFAYDSTVYSKDVRVVDYYSKGEFTGGFNKSDTFTWVRSVDPSAFTHSYDSIADKTISLYNSDIVANHRCTLYSPE